MLVALLLWSCDTADCEPQTWYVDSDGDGYHAGILPIASCEAPEDGYVLDGGDCDDGDISVSPAAAEVCDGADNDCDGTIDEDAPRWYADEDADGYGASTEAGAACEAPDGAVDNSDDCDDTDGAVYPGAPELCDARANGCDAAWSPSDEAGLASFVDADGAWHDVTADFSVLDAPGTLWLCEGEYTGPIAVLDDADVRGRGAVTLDGAGTDPVISVDAGVSATIAGVILRGGSADSGGGLWVGADAAVSVEDTTIEGNTAAIGGGIYIDSGATVSAKRVTLAGNTAADGGGLYAAGADGAKVLLTLSSVDFTENTASQQGGAMYLAFTTASLSGGQIGGSAADTGGGLSMRSSSVELSDTVVYESHADTQGAALYLEAQAQLRCTSSVTSTSSSTYGVHSSTGAYAVYMSDADNNTLKSEGCDWGIEDDDNALGDILLVRPYSYGLSETFTCASGTGCR